MSNEISIEISKVFTLMCLLFFHRQGETLAIRDLLREHYAEMKANGTEMKNFREILLMEEILHQLRLIV